MYPVLDFLVVQLGGRLARTRREEGASAVEWVVIAAVLVAICGAVGAILLTALNDKATDIGTDIEGS